MVSAVFSYLTDWLHRRLGDRGSVVMIVLVCSLPIYLMGIWISPLAALLVLTQNVARGYMGPFVGYLLNVRTNSENRATMLSLKATALYLGESVGLQLFGWLLGCFTLFECLQLLGGVALILGVMLVISQGLIFSKRG
jgi:hypothetical protein